MNEQEQKVGAPLVRGSVSTPGKLRELLDAPPLGYAHVRQEDVHAGSARDVNPGFAAFDVVFRRDYDELAASLPALLDCVDALRGATAWRDKAAMEFGREALARLDGGSDE